MGLSISGIPVDPHWEGYDCQDWRHHPEPEGIDQDDDEDTPCPPDVEMVLGFDPDKE